MRRLPSPCLPYRLPMTKPTCAVSAYTRVRPQSASLLGRKPPRQLPSLDHSLLDNAVGACKSVPTSSRSKPERTTRSSSLSVLKRPASARVRPMEENGDLVDDLYRTDIEANFLVKGVRARREENPFIKNNQGCFEVLQNRFDFEDIALGTSVSKIFRCRNMSSVVERVRIKGGKDARVSFQILSTTAVAPGMSAMIQIIVSGDVLGSIKEVLSLQAGKEMYHITVLANVQTPDKVQRANTEAYSGLDADLLDMAPRLPGTYFNLKSAKLCFERPFRYEIDHTLSLEEIQRRDREHDATALKAPLLPHCVRVYTQIRLGDERIKAS